MTESPKDSSEASEIDTLVNTALGMEKKEIPVPRTAKEFDNAYTELGLIQAEIALDQTNPELYKKYYFYAEQCMRYLDEFSDAFQHNEMVKHCRSSLEGNLLITEIDTKGSVDFDTISEGEKMQLMKIFYQADCLGHIFVKYEKYLLARKVLELSFKILKGNEEQIDNIMVYGNTTIDISTNTITNFNEAIINEPYANNLQIEYLLDIQEQLKRILSDVSCDVEIYTLLWSNLLLLRDKLSEYVKNNSENAAISLFCNYINVPPKINRNWIINVDEATRDLFILIETMYLSFASKRFDVDISSMQKAGVPKIFEDYKVFLRKMFEIERLSEISDDKRLEELYRKYSSIHNGTFVSQNRKYGEVIANIANHLYSSFTED